MQDIFMNNLNSVFLEEFKRLDSICRDIYGKTIDNKLGITMYLDDMRNHDFEGQIKVPFWEINYHTLKKKRDLRNELVHGNCSINIDACSEEDIDFLISFKEKILNQADPLAMLRKQTQHYSRHSYTLKPQTPHTPIKSQQNRTKNKSFKRFGVVFAFLFVFIFITILSLLLLFNS